MNRGLTILTGLGGALLLSACSTPALLTVTVYDSDARVVRLQAMPDAIGGRGFTHPAILSEQTVAAVLSGLVVEQYTAPIPLVFRGSGAGRRSRAFTDAELKLLAPLLVKGLGMATPEEVVTFYETTDVSATQRVVTSGGLFVLGDELHVVLSNHRTKVPIWLDTEQYDAPYRMRPLESINPEPGRLLFEPQHQMSTSDRPGLGGVIESPQRHVAVRYQDLPAPPTMEGRSAPDK